MPPKIPKIQWFIKFAWTHKRIEVGVPIPLPDQQTVNREQQLSRNKKTQAHEWEDALIGQEKTDIVITTVEEINVCHLQ